MRARDLIGRKIVGVEWHRFSSERPFSRQNDCTDPVLIFDNGQRLAFVVQETEVGEYGIELVLSGKVNA